MHSVDAYEVRADNRGAHLISDCCRSVGWWYGEPNAVSNAIGYAQFYSRSHPLVIRVCDAAGNFVEMHEHVGEFKEP
jgi:hypothetical protein